MRIVDQTFRILSCLFLFCGLSGCAIQKTLSESPNDPLWLEVASIPGMGQYDGTIERFHVTRNGLVIKYLSDKAVDNEKLTDAQLQNLRTTIEPFHGNERRVEYDAASIEIEIYREGVKPIEIGATDDNESSIPKQIRSELRASFKE